MLVRKLTDCTTIIAGDETILRELLHPERDYPFGGRYSLAHAMLPVGKCSKPHMLASSEVYYILDGVGEMHINDETAHLAPGDVVEIPAGAMQWIVNVGHAELKFLCIVDPAWRKEDERIE